MQGQWLFSDMEQEHYSGKRVNLWSVTAKEGCGQIVYKKGKREAEVW